MEHFVGRDDELAVLDAAMAAAAAGQPRVVLVEGEADWIAGTVPAQVVMVPEAGHYPQSPRPGLTTAAVVSFLAAARDGEQV